jgi:Domain of unknown function (DUF4386)
MSMTQPATVPRPWTPRRADPDEAAGQGVRRSALVAGTALLGVAVLAAAGNFGAVQRLVTDGNATRTAIDIMAAQTTFSLGIAALVVVVALDIVVARALRTFFAPVHHRLASLAAWLRVSYAAIFAVAISQLFAALRLLQTAHHLTGFALVHRRTEAMQKIEAFQDIWRISLVLFGLHLVLIGYLTYRSGYAPRVLGVLLVIAGAGYLVDSFGGILSDTYSVNVSAVTFIGEALLLVWLLVKGRRITLPA